MTIKERLFIMPIKTYRINKIIIAEGKPTMSLIDLSVKGIWISDDALNCILVQYSDKNHDSEAPLHFD